MRTISQTKYILLVLAAFCYAVHSGQAQAQAPNEIFTSEINKNFYDNCKYAIYSDLSEEEFQKTPCYAHIAGSLQMQTVVSLHLAAYFQDIEKFPAPKKAGEDAFCDTNRPIRELAKIYVNIIDDANKPVLNFSNYKYDSFPSLMQHRICAPYFEED
jgi:hypothetical protein